MASHSIYPCGRITRRGLLHQAGGGFFGLAIDNLVQLLLIDVDLVPVAGRDQKSARLNRRHDDSGFLRVLRVTKPRTGPYWPPALMTADRGEFTPTVAACAAGASVSG